MFILTAVRGHSLFILTEVEKTCPVYINGRREAIPCLYSLKKRGHFPFIFTGERPFPVYIH